MRHQKDMRFRKMVAFLTFVVRGSVYPDLVQDDPSRNASSNIRFGIVEGSKVKRLAKSAESIPRAHKNRVPNPKVLHSLLTTSRSVLNTPRCRDVLLHAKRITFCIPAICSEGTASAWAAGCSAHLCRTAAQCSARSTGKPQVLLAGAFKAL